jgi:polar amino acid transport system substrate-binding protein
MDEKRRALEFDPAHSPHRRRLIAALSLCGLWACSRRQPEAKPAAPPPKPQRSVTDPDLVANGISLPGLTEGRISIDVYPAARAYANAASGEADFSFPVMRLGPDSETKQHYRFTTEHLGRVTFVLYSHVDRPLTRAAVLAAAATSKPYVIQAHQIDWGFPTRQFIDFESAFRQISARHIDGFLWAQEEADLVLRRLGLKDIHREHFMDYDDVFIVPRTPRGDFVDATLTRVIRAMRADGRLARLYEKVHRSFENWQPSGR